MADAQIIQIADAIVTNLNAADLNLPFTPSRKYVPHFDLEDLQSLQVTVSPAATAHSLASRSVWSGIYDIDVGVQKEAHPTTNSEIDPLMQLTDEIIDRLKGAGKMAGYTLVAVATTDPAFIEGQQKALHVFTSMTAFSYRKAR